MHINTMMHGRVVCWPRFAKFAVLCAPSPSFISSGVSESQPKNHRMRNHSPSYSTFCAIGRYQPDKVFIHMQIEDPEVTRLAQELLETEGSCIIPNDQVKLPRRCCRPRNATPSPQTNKRRNTTAAV